MKRISIFCLLLALFASLSGCNIPTPAAASTATSVPSATPYLPGTPTVPPVDTPVPTGSATIPAVDTPQPTISATALPDTPTPAPDRISLEQLKNGTYTVEAPNIQVALKNGEYTGDHVYSRFIEPAAFGDLNGDGLQDAVIVIATNTGGSGTFFDLVPLLNQNGTLVQSGYYPFGDRQVVKNLQIANGRVVLDYLTQSLTDGLCCPSEHRLRSYILENGKLLLASEQMLTSPNAQATPLPDAIFIDQPAEFATVTSPMTVTGRVSQVPPEKKLEYYITDRQATLLAQGEVPLEGEPGGPGTFTFTFTIDSVTYGVYKLEIIDTASGILRGRSMVELLGK